MKCLSEKCPNLHLALSKYCWAHLPDKEDYTQRLLEAIAKGEDLSGHNLQKIILKNAHLDKARLMKANLSQADLSGSYLFDAKLDGADLIGTRLSDCDMTHSSLKGADLTKADLNGSRLWNADLKGSNLSECDLSEADLWNARLFSAKLWHTNFRSAKSITQRNFSRIGGGPLKNPMINEEGLLSAEESYRDLKRYFLSSGMYNDASWASFKEKTMERLIFKKKKDHTYFPSLVMTILCGYGEKPYRIVLSALSAILGYALIYFMLNAAENSVSQNYTLRWSDYIYYSTITFTTVGYGDFVPKAYGLFRLLAASEAFLGVFLAGLFVFTLARKYSAR